MAPKLETPVLMPYGGRGLGEGATVCSPRGRRKIQLCMTRLGKPGAQMRSAHDVCQVVREIENADREHLVALHLDAKNRVIGIEDVAKGTLSAVETSPREVFKAAILSNAQAIIVAHNHPSGDVTPSQQDRDLTEQLQAAGRMLGIPVRDHVIVSYSGCSAASEDWRQLSGGLSGGGSKRRRRGKR